MQANTRSPTRLLSRLNRRCANSAVSALIRWRARRDSIYRAWRSINPLQALCPEIRAQFGHTSGTVGHRKRLALCLNGADEFRRRQIAVCGHVVMDQHWRDVDTSRRATNSNLTVTRCPR